MMARAEPVSMNISGPATSVAIEFSTVTTAVGSVCLHEVGRPADPQVQSDRGRT